METIQKVKTNQGWREVRLGEVASEIKSGGTPLTKQAEYYGGNIPWLNTKEVDFNRIFDTETKITEYGFENSSAQWVKENSVVVAMYGATAGKVALTKIPLTTNQACCNLTLDENQANYSYIYYNLFSRYSELVKLSSGAAQQNLNVGFITNLVVFLPPLPEQKAIAEVLSSLDDKIDLLHRQNKTLEAMAQTLFHKWFVEDADEEWEEVKLERFVKCTTGHSYRSAELQPSNLALVTLKNFARDGSFRMDGYKEFIGKFKNEQVVTQGDLVVSHTDITQEADVIGNPVLVVHPSQYETLVMTMDLMKVESTEEWLSKEFLFYLFKSLHFKSHCLGCSNGTTVLHMSRKAIPSYRFKIPNKEKIIIFTETVKPKIEKTFRNIATIKILENLRNTLLPKLMSGDVRVKN